ncbi:hypothetical protein BC937DRAFT_90349 [Endogone sp. FLAS-F59071]|nr:hypothetical protein BC937DRAFT_90349 [Endogone sp. FLAS-F59071]|eukprot:RUS23230.1 hypothetical protein BC937DRAFT_90349 [Endogone sp. FLAS-F59071]
MPKHYGEGYQGAFLVTEQMVELWKELSGDSNRSIKRVLSGPMGVGKSYLALFLAAKAYAEGWLLLYISDAKKLAADDACAIAEAICKPLLALNKDILTIDDFNRMTFWRDGQVVNIAHNILEHLLNQLEKKTLLIIDEHGALFGFDPLIPKRQSLLIPLMHLDAWNEERKGTRVVLTGAAHAAKFEREYIENGMVDWLVFVTPLSSFIFDKLLNMSRILSRAVIRDKVKEITNHVPRELVSMEKYVHEKFYEATKEALAVTRQPSTTTDIYASVTDQDILFSLQRFRQNRRRECFAITEKCFYKDLQPTQRHAQRCALAAMFLPRKENDTDFNYQPFDYQFMDLGLVYRLEYGQYHPLYQAARDALLDIYKAMPLSNDVALAITSGNMDRLQFEAALFQQLLRFPEVILKATDLAGVEQTPVPIVFKHFKMLQDPPLKTSDNVLLRCYPTYPRFDFILGCMFIQTSISDFTTHNKDSADIEKAFEHSSSSRPTRSFDLRSQIEKYLDFAFGGCDLHKDGNGCHCAKIDPNSRRFIVTRDGKTVHDFRIVYIRGSPGFPNHTGKVEEFPDVLHVSFEELQDKLFGNLLIERRSGQ